MAKKTKEEKTAAETTTSTPATPATPEEGKRETKKERKLREIAELVVHEQKDEKGNPEFLPGDIFCVPVRCACGETRWCKKSDAHQVRLCKPCQAKAQKAKLRDKKKAKDKAKRAELRELREEALRKAMEVARKGK